MLQNRYRSQDVKARDGSRLSRRQSLVKNFTISTACRDCSTNETLWRNRYIVICQRIYRRSATLKFRRQPTRPRRRRRLGRAVANALTPDQLIA